MLNIAFRFGRDHTSIVAALRRIKTKAPEDFPTSREIEARRIMRQKVSQRYGRRNWLGEGVEGD